MNISTDIKPVTGPGITARKRTIYYGMGDGEFAVTIFDDYGEWSCHLSKSDLEKLRDLLNSILVEHKS